MDNSTLKKILRKRLNAERKALSQAEIVSKSKQVFEKWLARFSMKPVMYLHLYQHIKQSNELHTHHYMDYVRSKYDHVRLVVPIIDPYTNSLWHVELSNDIEMEINPWGIPEPKFPHRKIFPMQLDMVLVPMLGFDMQGNRLGYGKGYYDRFLRLLNPQCLKIGLCLEQGKVDEGLPTEEHDIPMDYIVSELAVYHFSSNTQTI